MSGCVGAISTFIVEPFMPHGQEFYLSIQSKRLGCDLSFSEAGGVEIEENWDKASPTPSDIEQVTQRRTCCCEPCTCVTSPACWLLCASAQHPVQAPGLQPELLRGWPGGDRGELGQGKLRSPAR